jgi:Zn-dependent M28 family amino/carboxypeptidase
MGYQTKVLYFVPGTGSPAPAGEGVRTIVAIRPGRALPDHVIAWAAHYDTTATTVYGAYDDGSGTGVAMEIARVFASYPNNKTVMALFFDAEEEGLLGSSYFVKEATGNKNATFDFFVGLDMTGINCPGYKWPMVQFIGAKYDADVKPVLEAVDGAKLSSAANRCIAWEDSDPRSSDELSFQSAGVPILRLAGGFNASDYPAYHMPTDTVDYVYNFTGGPERYEAGVNLTVSAAYWALAAFDRSPPLT